MTTKSQSLQLAVPLVGTGSYSFLQPNISSSGAQCWVRQQLNGTFTICPAERFTGKVLDSASSATTPDGSPRNHSKFDNAKFRYNGRSYGVGAAVGLTDSGLIQSSNFQEYVYNEVGYMVTASCIHNSSSLWVLYPNFSEEEAYNNSLLGIPNIF